MTGFALVCHEGEWGELALELRAVNHRYLDLKIGLPEALRALENPLRKRLRANLARGRIEAQLRWRAAAGAGLAVNEALVHDVMHAARRLAGEAQVEVPLATDVLRLLAWPGVVEPPVVATDALLPVLEALSEEAVAGLVAAREREGVALAEALVQRIDRLEACVAAIAEHLPTAKLQLQSRLAARLSTLGDAVDTARVAQEAALLIVRQDVNEELDRLRAHATEVRRLLNADKPVGRRLDFLMQELGREAGTLASKAGDLEINRWALDCRVLVEEMREQVQNVE
jgi:uncharacterized protein (TIGR00255 family)